MPLDEKPGPAAVRFIRGWDVPVGGILLTVAGFYALLGFPLDDVWHRLFGQDVTLWGPTHLMLIGGAGLSIVGLLVLEQEGHGGALHRRRRRARPGAPPGSSARPSAMGGLLLGMSVFQGEYDFDVPQFRLVLEPFMIAGAAGIALVAARLFMGRGGALAAAAFFLVIRGGIALVVGPRLRRDRADVPALPRLGDRRRAAGAGPVAGPPAARVRRRRRRRASAPLGHATEWRLDAPHPDAVVEQRHPRRGHAHGDRRRRGRRPARRPARARPAPPAAPPGRGPHGPASASLVVLAACVTNGLLATVPDDVEATFAIDRRPDRPADRGHHRPARPGRLRRRPGVGADHLVAGPGPGGRRPGADRRGRVPDDRAGPAARRPGRRCCGCTTAGC